MIEKLFRFTSFFILPAMLFSTFYINPWFWQFPRLMSITTLLVTLIVNIWGFKFDYITSIKKKKLTKSSIPIEGKVGLVILFIAYFLMLHIGTNMYATRNPFFYAITTRDILNLHASIDDSNLSAIELNKLVSENRFLSTNFDFSLLYSEDSTDWIIFSEPDVYFSTNAFSIDSKGRFRNHRRADEEIFTYEKCVSDTVTDRLF